MGSPNRGKSTVDEGLQFDPALREILLRAKVAPRIDEQKPAATAPIPVVACLYDPLVPVDGLDVVARFGDVVTGRVDAHRIIEVHTNRNVRSLKASRAFVPELAVSVPEIRALPDELTAVSEGRPPDLSGVIIGFVDWGCDFVHANFRDTEGRTRIVRLWDQRGGLSDRSPRPYSYGREWTAEEIDQALATEDPYAALGYDPIDADPIGSGAHGTHVMGIAAGNGRAPGSSPGVAPGVNLAFVHLKGEDTRAEDSLGDSVRLLEAIRYLFDVAGDRKLVVNCSLGTTGGPHDGTTLVERALDNLLDANDRAVVMSTGNYQGARMTSVGRLSQGEARELQWRVTPRHDEISELEIWYSGLDVFSIQLRDPSGQVVAVAPLGRVVAIGEGEATVGTVHHRYDDPNNHAHHVDIFLWAEAAIGIWTVMLIAEKVLDGRYHAWIERDDPGSQSRFEPNVASDVCTSGTIVNGHRTLSTGAYDPRGLHALVSFSSSGPTRDLRQVPVVVAPGAGIRSARSSRHIRGGRARDESVVMSGTSMAAPHVAGVAALVMGASPVPLHADEIRSIIVRTCRPFPAEAQAEKTRRGAGRVDAAAAVAAARSTFGKPFSGA